MKHSLPAIAMLCAVLATGCGKDHGTPVGEDDLTDTRWMLTATSADSFDPAQFMIMADFTESRISGVSAVNSYSGSYAANADGAFSIRELQSTEMGGSIAAMDAEAVYFDLLLDARRYSVNDTTLRLMDQTDRDLLVFTRR